MATAGWLGEISTDVAWVERVKPNPAISGKENLLVVYPHPLKVLVGDSIKLEAVYFEKGRKKEADISFSSQNEQVLCAENNGWVQALSTGKTEIRIAANREVETVPVKVVKPDSIQLLTGFSAVYPGDTLDLVAQVFDSEQEKLEIPVRFSSLNPAVGEVLEMDGKTFFVSRQAGETILTCWVEGFEVETQVAVKVLSPDDKIRIYFTLKTEEENLLPFQWIEVGMNDLNSFVESRQTDYSGLEKPTLFHALAAGLQKANVPFVFRDDDAANGKVYLHSVESDGWFYNAWGGKTEPEAYTRAWIARLNNQPFLNDFDKEVISAGDTVSVYHVSKITEPWIYSRLLAGSDSALVGDEIEVELSQSECTFFEGEVLESKFVPVPHAEIFAGNVYYTDNSGKAVFTLESEPPLIIFSGVDAVLISKKLTTGISTLENQAFRVYPNPVESELIVEVVENGGIFKSALKLFTAGGQIVFEKEINLNLHRFNLSNLPSGIYYLKVIQGTKTEMHKIIKK